MCLYVGSEVILANLLSRKKFKKNGVSQEDIVLYCRRLKDALSNSNIRNVYINSNVQEMDHALTKYSKEFRYFQGRYFENEEIRPNHFNARYDDSIVSTFKKTAEAL